MKKFVSYIKEPGLFQRLWKKFLSLFFFEQWSLLISNTSNGLSASWSDFKLLTPPKDRFWADPFLWEKNGEQYIFFEELPYITMKGYISCLKIDQEMNIVSNEIVLERPYHLSYPFLFEYRDQLYMLPEAKQNNEIELYQCQSFPNKWEKVSSLISNIQAVDSTLLEWNNKWWLFTNVAKVGGNAYDSLYLFFADSPLSTNWTPHPLNPVVQDIKRARPAGNIIQLDNSLIRPSQDCSVRYGYAINFNRIDILSETEYKETHLNSFLPPKNNKDVLATHTWNQLGNLQVIDAEYWRRR